MKSTLSNVLFYITAFALAVFATTMYVKYESNESMKTYVYKVRDCRKDVNTVCQRMAVRPIRMTED